MRNPCERLLDEFDIGTGVGLGPTAGKAWQLGLVGHVATTGSFETRWPHFVAGWRPAPSRTGPQYAHGLQRLVRASHDRCRHNHGCELGPCA